MRVAIHQPNFLPWLGYFYKLARADIFVLLDDVQFIKEGFVHRNYIKTCQGKQWLGVPVCTKGRAGQPINKTEISYDKPWQRKAAATLLQQYARAIHVDQYVPAIQEILCRDHRLLVDLNVSLLEFVRVAMGLETPIVRSSDLKGVNGTATERLISICKAVGATEYMSGAGARSYQDEEMFRAGGINLLYSDFVHPTYPQPFGAFEPNLSAIDLVLNVGPKSRDVLLAASKAPLAMA
jgi:hypothetical protein